MKYRTLPLSLASLKALRVLKLSQQLLSGAVPTAYNASDAFTALETLDLSNNKLGGRLPHLPGADTEPLYNLNNTVLTPPCFGLCLLTA